MIHFRRSQSEMHPLTRLCQVAITGSNSPDSPTFGRVPHHQFNACSDGVRVGRSTFKTQRHIIALSGHIIAQKPKLWATAIGDPKIEISVGVPVDDGNPSTVIGKIKPTGHGDVRESTTASIQESAMALAGAESATAANELAESASGALAIHFRGIVFLWVIDRRATLRHDLSPEETSQVTRVLGRDVAIGDEEVFPAIVVQIGK